MEHIIRVGMSKPKTLLLLMLGGGARGKTATVNSLRRIPFVQTHSPIEMAAFSKNAVEPGGKRGEEEIAEIAYRGASLRVNASRCYDISLPARGILLQSGAAGDDGRQCLGVHVISSTVT